MRRTARTSNIFQPYGFMYAFCPVTYLSKYSIFFYLGIFFFKTEKLLRLPCIKFNTTITSLKHAFHLSLHVAAGNTEEKHYETFHIFNLSLGPLNGVNSVNRSDLKISKQISPMSVCLSVTNVRTYTDILKNV